MGRTKRFIYITNILNLVIKMENEDKIPIFDKHKKDYKIGDLVITWKAYEDAKKILIQKYNMVEELIKVFEKEGEPDGG